MRNIDAGVLHFVYSASIKDEYLSKLDDPRVKRLFERHSVELPEVRELIEALCAKGDQRTPGGVAPAFRDEKDRRYLHCAEEDVQYLVTFDGALLDKGAHGRTIILTPADLIRQLVQRSDHPLID